MAETYEQAPDYPRQEAEEALRQAPPPPVPAGVPGPQVEEEQRLRSAFPTMFNADGSPKF